MNCFVSKFLTEQFLHQFNGINRTIIECRYIQHIDYCHKIETGNVNSMVNEWFLVGIRYIIATGFSTDFNTVINENKNPTFETLGKF